MIELNELIQAMENGLNQNEKGISFAVFGDTDNYLHPSRKGNVVTEYINCLLQIVQSNSAPTQVLAVATQTARLEVMIPIADDNTPIQEQIEPYRQVLDAYFQKPSVQVLKDPAGKTFSVGMYGTPANSGERAQRQFIGDSFTFVVYVYYSFIENGLNSLQCPIYLDDIQLPYETATISRIPTAEGNPYSDDTGAAKNRIVATALSVDITLPATSGTALSQTLLGFILTGAPNTHTLRIEADGQSQTYTVVMGETNINFNGVLNGGHTLSLIEAVNYGE